LQKSARVLRHIFCDIRSCRNSMQRGISSECMSWRCGLVWCLTCVQRSKLASPLTTFACSSSLALAPCLRSHLQLQVICQLRSSQAVIDSIARHSSPRCLALYVHVVGRLCGEFCASSHDPSIAPSATLAPHLLATSLLTSMLSSLSPPGPSAHSSQIPMSPNQKKSLPQNYTTYFVFPRSPFQNRWRKRLKC
jgi:hypothetical protein